MQPLTVNPSIFERLVERAQRQNRTVDDLVTELLDQNDAPPAKAENHAAEQALKLAHDTLGSILDTVTDVMSASRLPDMQMLYISHSAEELYGVPVSAFYQQPELRMKMVHPDDFGQLQSHNWHELLRSSGVADCRYRVVRADGDIRWVHHRAWVVQDEDGTPIRLAEIVRDITQERRQESRAYVQLKALEAAANAVVITDRDANIEWANPAFTRLTGYTLEEAIHKNPSQLVRSGMHDDVFYRQMWDTLLAGKVWEGKLVNRRKDGVLYTEEQTITPIFDDKGDIIRFVAIKQDITQREQTEQLALEQERLRATLKKEQEFNGLIQRAIASLAHDIRTPLAAIATSKDLLLRYYEQMSSEHRRSKLDGIGLQLHIVTELLNDLTLVLGNSIHKHRLNPALVNLPALCKLIVQEMQVLASPQHRLHFSADERIHSAVVDEVLVSRILLNLLSNAIKYSPNGGDIRLELRAQDNQLIFRIADHGLGIADSELPYIFEPLYRVKAHSSIPGTGLGLSIVQECVAQHRGSIAVESVPDKGTTFSVTLPNMGSEALLNTPVLHPQILMKPDAKVKTSTMRAVSVDSAGSILD